MGLIDFQGLQWCQGIRDVQYHLINSLEPDVLAAHEDELIRYYLGELERHGVDLPAADARQQYRALSFQTLMVAVISLQTLMRHQYQRSRRTIPLPEPSTMIYFQAHSMVSSRQVTIAAKPISRIIVTRDTRT